jgi:hypothetical protein
MEKQWAVCVESGHQQCHLRRVVREGISEIPVKGKELGK